MVPILRPCDASAGGESAESSGWSAHWRYRPSCCLPRQRISAIPGADEIGGGRSHPEPGCSIAVRRTHVRRFRRRPSRRRIDGLQCGQIRPQTCALDQFHQHPARRLAAVLRVPTAFVSAGLRRFADRLAGHPQRRQRHARRFDRPGRRVAATESVCVCHLGQGEQQPADLDLG